MAQFGRPISDLQNTSITGGFGAIDETSASDADFLYSADNTDTVYECGLTSTLLDPTTGSSHTFRYRIAEIDGGVLGDGAGNGTVTVQTSLRQGATVIATDTTRNCTNAWSSHTLTITTGEADNITDYTNLRLYFNILSPTGGAPGGRRGAGISWGELEVPERITIFDESITLSGGSSIINVGELVMLPTLTLSSDNIITNSVGLNIDEGITLTTDNDFITSLELFINPTLTLSSDNLISNTEFVNFYPTLILSSDNTVSDNSLSDSFESIIESIDIGDIYNVGKEFQDTLTLSSDNIISVAEIVTSTFNESISLNSLVKLETSVRKNDLLTLISIAKIISVGKIIS